MFIIPYILTSHLESKSEFKIWLAWVFTADKQIWETDPADASKSHDEIVEEYLAPNGIYGNIKPSSPEYLLYEVDTTKTNIKDFYTSRDDVSEGNMWQSFVWVGSNATEDDMWGWSIAAHDLPLGKFGTVNTLWKLLRT